VFKESKLALPFTKIAHPKLKIRAVKHRGKHQIKELVASSDFMHS